MDSHGNYRGMASHDPEAIEGGFTPSEGTNASMIGITPITEEEHEQEAEVEDHFDEMEAQQRAEDEAEALAARTEEERRD